MVFSKTHKVSIRHRQKKLLILLCLFKHDVFLLDMLTNPIAHLYFDCLNMTFSCLNMTFSSHALTRERRVELLAKWRRKGGVFLISYSSFRNLSLGKYVKDNKMAQDIIRALQVIEWRNIWLIECDNLFHFSL